MFQPNESNQELFLRFTRRSMYVVLILIALLGAGGIAMALKPAGIVSQWLTRAPWFIPVAIPIALVALQTPLRRRGLTLESPEARVVMEDELRKTNMDRALRGAFTIILLVQVPLALAFSGERHGLLAMAIATVAIGMTALIALFLVLDRDVRDER